MSLPTNRVMESLSLHAMNLELKLICLILSHLHMGKEDLSLAWKLVRIESLDCFEDAGISIRLDADCKRGWECIDVQSAECRRVQD